MEIAVLADIHGNCLALEAVLEDIARRNIGRIVHLGDCLYGPLDPTGTADLLMQRAIPGVSGNEDRMLVHPDESVAHSPSWKYTVDCLSEAHKKWLRELPPVLEEGDMLAFHGTPHSDTTYLLEKVTQRGVEMRSTAELNDLLAGFGKSVLLCGHSHMNRSRWLPDGRLILNPGSVGLPAYRGAHPFRYAMEAGVPHARYAIVRQAAAGWQFEHIALPYDWQSASQMALDNGRPDWAHALRSGFAIPVEV